MHMATLSVLMLAVVALAIGNLSAAPNFNLKLDVQDDGSVNLYKEFFLYLSAVLSQGIPALQIDPLDPYYIKLGIEITKKHNPHYPNYNNMTVDIRGATIAGFSQIEVPTAELNLDEMFANLSISNNIFLIRGENVLTSVLNSDGRLLQYNCSHVYITVFDSLFTSDKQLELIGNQLQVKQFDLEYEASDVMLVILPSMCVGDDELQEYLHEVLRNLQIYITDELIPQTLKYVSLEATRILNGIFALRNVTDDGSFDKPTVQERLESMHELPESDDHSKHFIRRSSHQKSTDRSKDDLKIKWSFN